MSELYLKLSQGMKNVLVGSPYFDEKLTITVFVHDTYCFCKLNLVQTIWITEFVSWNFTITNIIWAGSTALHYKSDINFHCKQLHHKFYRVILWPFTVFINSKCNTIVTFTAAMKYYFYSIPANCAIKRAFYFTWLFKYLSPLSHVTVDDNSINSIQLPWQ